jgi:ribosomal protein S8
MKHIAIMMTLVIIIILIIKADLRINTEQNIPAKQKGCGYTVIEAGKGINCKGDTISIHKVHGKLALQ